MADNDKGGQRPVDDKVAHAAVLAEVAKSGWGPTFRFAFLQVSHRLPWYLWAVTSLVGGGGVVTAIGHAQGWSA